MKARLQDVREDETGGRDRERYDYERVYTRAAGWLVIGECKRVETVASERASIHVAMRGTRAVAMALRHREISITITWAVFNES